MSASSDTLEPAPGESSGVIRVPSMAPGEDDPAALSGVDYPVESSIDEPPAPTSAGQDDSGLVHRELGTYRLLSLLGGTGMSRVYLAEQATGNKRFAVKVLRNANFNQAALDVVVRRFVQEARIASRLNHRHIVDVVDFGVAEGMAYLVMEYLDGESLRETLKRHGPLPWTRVLPMFLHICDALEAAHAKGVIHRDLKPSNCFRIRHATGDDYIKVCDFGLARIVDEDLPDGLLAGGVLLATPESMAPELIRGAKPDPRVDIYGVGVLLYELLTGTCPFQSGKQTTVLAMQLLDTAIPPRRVAPNANIPSSVERVIMRALSKQPEERFQSIADMRGALLDDTRVYKSIVADPSGRRRVSGPTATRSLSSVPVVVTSRGGIGMTIVLAMIAVGLIGWVLAGTPGIGVAEVPHESTAPNGIAAPATPSPTPTKTTPTPPTEPPVRMLPPGDPEPEPEDTPPVEPEVKSVPEVVPPPTKKGDGKKKPVDPDANEPVNYDIVDDPDAPIEVSGAEIDGVLRPFRPAASECGKANGVALGTDIGVKMLLASDGKLTNVQATDRPASDPAVQCILGLVKGARIELGARSKVTSAFFNYSFKVY
jgi:serine/threonine-protein kinase